MAQVKISALPESTGLVGQQIPGVQSGVTVKTSGMLDAATIITALGFTPAPINSPLFTGNPRGPTPATADNSTSLATTAFVKAQGYVTALTAPVISVAGKTGAVTLVVGDVSGAAPLASPALTGIPTAPTAAPGTNTTQLATTAFVTGAGFQAGTQYQNQGSNVGTPGSETVVNFTGTGVTASISGGTLSVNIPGGGTGSVTSVNVSGGTTGLSFTGGPITGSGTITAGGTLAIANGGTGQATATTAFAALAPVSPAKGDIIAYTGSAWVKHTHGTDGQVIVYDSSQADGLSNQDSPFVVPQALATSILADNPIAYWKWNEPANSTTITDYSGNGQTLNTSSAIFGGGGLASAQFIPSQVDKYVNFSDSGATMFGIRTGVPFGVPLNSSITVEAAISLTDLTTSGIASKTIIGCSGATGSAGAGNCQFQWYLSQITSYVYSFTVFWESGTNSSNIFSTDVALYADARVVWASIVKNSVAKTLTLYINGRKASVNTYTTEPTGGGGTLFTYVGASNRTNSPTATSPLLGNLGHLCVFSGVLSEARIVAHAKAAGLYTG